MFAIPIKIQYGVELEVNRVRETLDDLKWLTENSYKFLLPNGVRDCQGAQTEVIKKLVENEYDLKLYLAAEEAILKSWKGNGGLMKKINERMNGSYILDEIIIILTKYGTQGSYMTPNKAIINISRVPPEYLIKTVIHESLHLMIENLIKKNLVEHWVKEHIVDLIMDFEYKSRFKMQQVPNWVLPVDTIFKECYPDLTLITEKAAKISPESK